jgi:hypothetical protein
MITIGFSNAILGRGVDIKSLLICLEKDFKFFLAGKLEFSWRRR